MQGGDGRPIEVFYSYSHDDEEDRKKLGKHLSVLRRAGLIADWHDREIDAGTAWQEKIDRHLLSADIVLLLVSASFIASDYCWGDEMTKALARHKDGKARVIPIILHPCGWLRTPLKVLQGVPRDNKAISLWANEHAAFDHVVTEIAKVVDDLRRRKGAEPELVEQASAVAVVAAIPSAESPAPPHPGPLPAGEGDRAEGSPAGVGAAGVGAAGAGSPAGVGAAGAPHPPADAVPSLSRRERGGVRVDPRNLPDFTVFRDLDAPWCPEMVVIPAGRFLMGSPEEEKERDEDEGPQHRVRIHRSFGLGRYPVTVGEYRHFVEVRGRTHEGGIYTWTESGWKQDSSKSWQDPDFDQSDRHPVVGVSWRDAQAYVAFLGTQTGKPYRLPSEAEWEYACRAATTTPFSFGETITTDEANYDGNSVYGNGRKGVYRQGTTAVGSFRANPWGLFDMHGNVWEWVEDVWYDNYKGAPTDGSARAERSFRNRVYRGGSWVNTPGRLRSSIRNRDNPERRYGTLGFRVARTLS